MNFGYPTPQDLMMQQQQQQQQQMRIPVHQVQVPGYGNGNNDVPLEVIKAKRREVEQKLEALLALRGRNGNDNEGYSSVNDPQACTTNANQVTNQDPNLDSNDWMAFANLMDNNNNGNIASTNPNMSMSMSMPPLQQPEMPSAPSRFVSDNNEQFVLSDRLAEILPELEVNYEVPSEEDTNGLIQFFADGDAWLNSNRNKNNNVNMNANHSNNPPSLLHNISIVSDTTGASSSTGSLSSRSTTPPPPSTVARKKRTKTNTNAAGGSKRKLGRPSAFPQKLYTMLTSVPQQDPHLSHIVGFTPDGTAFEIFDNEAFVEAILPKYFKMSSFSSFQRQLQLYNFKRVSKGGAYRHPLFHRDIPDNLSKMARKQSKPSTFVLSLSASK